MTRLRITNVRRTSKQFNADIEIDGRTVGRVERGWVQGGAFASDYIAKQGTTIVATGRTLTELRAELREHFANEYQDARESW